MSIVVVVPPEGVGRADAVTVDGPGVVVHHPDQIDRRPPVAFRGVDRDQARSKRSRFMTLSHAATKSRTNACCESSHA